MRDESCVSFDDRVSAVRRVCECVLAPAPRPRAACPEFAVQPLDAFRALSLKANDNAIHILQHCVQY